MKNTRPQFIVGNAIDVLRDLDDDSIDLVVTSPPYWGLRDYGSGTDAIWGGDGECVHQFWPDVRQPTAGGRSPKSVHDEDWQRKGTTPNETTHRNCPKCGAWRGQLGLEPTWQLYVEHLVEISKEIKRVLKPTGSYYLVLGDTYAGSRSYQVEQTKYQSSEVQVRGVPMTADGSDGITKPKQKLLIPYRVAMGLQEDGWICRNDITWRKPNAMPSSVKDRLTCTTERIFHFVKARKYFYDLDAIRKPSKTPEKERFRPRSYDSPGFPSMKSGKPFHERFNPAGKNPGDAVETKAVGTPYEAQYRNEDTIFGRNRGKQGHPSGRNPGDSVETRQKMENVPGQTPTLMARKKHSGYFLEDGEFYTNPKGRNPGDYFNINTQPFPQAHFAVFPESLIEPIIKSSCPLEVCSECGKPTMTVHKLDFESDVPDAKIVEERCDCNAEFVPGIVLDPFCGSGTTSLVAMKLGRASIGIDINSDYIKMAQKRCRVDIPSLQDFGVGDE